MNFEIAQIGLRERGENWNDFTLWVKMACDGSNFSQFSLVFLQIAQIQDREYLKTAQV